MKMHRSILLQFRTGQRGNSLQGWAGKLIVLLVLCVSSQAAKAQLTTSDILGTVTDTTGAVVQNAPVVLQNVDTKATRTATTNSSGDYTFTLLPTGRYVVTVKMSGFKTSTTTNLAVEAGDRARADIALQIGGENETVNVEAQTPLLQADSATVSSTVTAKAVQDLPLNGRNFVQLVQIVPGANEGPGNGLTSGARPDDRRQTSGFSVNGQDDTLNNYTIDGIDDNERIIGTIGVKPNVEGIQEISVQTNSYAAEAGRTAGGVVNIVTRSGTNQFHGSAYEFFRNDIFDARSVFQVNGNKPELRQNQFGGSIGGPILRDRAFFFFDYEGYRQVAGQTFTNTVPTLSEYNNINSIGGGSPQAIVAAGNGTAGLPIDPIALNYLKLFPAPNAGGAGQLTNNYVISPNRTQYSNTYDARVDHRFNSNNQVFARFNYNKVDSAIPPGLGTVNGLQISGGRYNFSGPATDKASQYVLGYTHIFTQNLIMDLRAAYTRINNQSLPLNYGANADTTVGFGANMNFNLLSNVLTPIQFGPFNDIGDGAYVPLQDIDGTYQYSGTLSWTKGNHNLKFGGSFIRRQARNLQSAFPAGQYTFGLVSDANNNQLTQQNNQLASSLVGAFSAASRSYSLTTPDYRTYEPSGFAQDSWKATSKLTLLAGVRYDVFTPFTEAHNHISNFDFYQASQATAATVGDALKVPGVNADGHANIHVDYSNVAPRVGFSFSASPLTVIRGGYGLSYFPGNYTSNANLKNAPFISVYNPNCQSALAVKIEGALAAGQNPACNAAAGQSTTFDQGLPLPVAQTLTSPSLSFYAYDPKFRAALIQQFNMQVQQQLGANVLTIGYVGNIGQHLTQTVNDINQPAPFNPLVGTQAQRTAAATRPLGTVLPNLGQVDWLQSEGVSNYHALQTSLQRRFTRGLAYDLNYTWGKELNDVTGFSNEGAQGFSNADPRHIRQIDYGVGENDIQNRFAASVNYEFQYGKTWTGIKKLGLAGWQVNTIAVWQSGKPFTVLNAGGTVDVTTEPYINPTTGQPGINPSTGLPTTTANYSNRATPLNNGGQDRPNIIASPNLGHKSLTNFFNTAAFVPQALGTVGSEKRGSLFGPHYRHVDLSLFKDFHVTERYNVQFRAESFNLTNTPNYIITTGNNTASLGNSAFGGVNQTDANYSPRELQFALKLQF